MTQRDVTVTVDRLDLREEANRQLWKQVRRLLLGIIRAFDQRFGIDPRDLH